MKNKLVTFLMIAFCVGAIPSSVSAASYRYTPPARTGIIYVVVSYKGYNSRDPYSKTAVRIRWGSYTNSKSYYGTVATLRPTLGVVIALKHTRIDSAPLTVDTDGRIERVEQMTSPPSQWNSGKYKTEHW